MKTKPRWVFGIVAGIALAVGAWFTLRPVPQLGSSPAVYPMVDALYTAVRNEDTLQLDATADRLRTAYETGQLPAPAWKTLSGIIADARAGRWRASTETLYTFMRAQRRESP